MHKEPGWGPDVNKRAKKIIDWHCIPNQIRCNNFQKRMLRVGASWLIGFVASWFLGFLVSWLLGFLDPWFLSFAVLGFSVSKCLSFLVPKFQSFKLPFHVFGEILIAYYQQSISWFLGNMAFHVFGKMWIPYYQNAISCFLEHMDPMFKIYKQL